MAGDLRLRHREPHRPEESALSPFDDVTLGLLVRRRRPHDVEPQFLTQPAQLIGGHP